MAAAALLLVGTSPRRTVALESTLTTPNGISLRLLRDPPLARRDPSGFTVDVDAELSNGGEEARFVFTSLGALRGDLHGEYDSERQPCKHNFLWWHWDCPPTCAFPHLPSDPNYLTNLCYEDPPLLCCPGVERVVQDPDATPAPADGMPAADIVLGIAASSDLDRIAEALDVERAMLDGLSPPLKPGDTWRLHVPIPVVLANPGADLPTVAVTVADDVGFTSQVLPVQLNSCTPPPVGMVAWYPLDEPTGATVIDDIAPPPASTADNQGTPQPGGQVGNGNGPDTVPGEVQDALFFAGIGDYVEVADHPDLNFGKFDFSIDAWVAPLQLGPTIIQPIVDKLALSFPAPNPPTGTGYALYVQDQRLHFVIGDGGPLATYSSDTASPITVNPLPSTLVWTHVAVTVQHGSGAVTLYINGAPVGLENPVPSLPAGSTSTSSTLLIGHSRLPVDLLGEIGIDELEIFSRALAPAEIADLYQAGANGKCRGCVGDCDGDGTVTINELITLVNIALGNSPLDACLAGDADHDGTVTIAELIAAVANALNGCTTPGGPSPTPTASPQSTPTSTASPQPTPTATATASPFSRPPTATASRTATPTPSQTGTQTLTSTPTPCCMSPAILDLSSGQAAVGQNDPLWRLLSAPAGTGGGTPPHPAVVIDPNLAGPWTVLAGTHWTSANTQCTATNAADCPGGTYTYELCWSQCGSLDDFTQLELLADNGATILLNGVQIGASNSFKTAAQIALTDPGPGAANCLRVVVANNPSSTTGGSATGFDLSGSISGCVAIVTPTATPTATPTSKVPPPN